MTKWGWARLVPAAALLVLAAGCGGSTEGGQTEGVAVGQAVDSGDESSSGGQDTVTTATTTGAGASQTQATTGGGATAGGDQSAGVVAYTMASSIVGEPTEMSPDLNTPEDDRGVLVVSRARTAPQHGEYFAASGNQLAIVDFEFYYTKISNLFDNAFRIVADGQTYPAISGLNVTGNFGQIYNGELVFEVPAGLTTMTVEGGLPAGTPGGLTASFELTFDGGESYTEEVAGVVADTEASQITGTATVIGTDVNDDELALLEMTGARLTSRDGDVFAHEGTMLVVVSFDLSQAAAYGNVLTPAFRLRADDEWYSPQNFINETLNVGETISLSAVFEVPTTATEFVFEAGPPATLMEQYAGFPLINTETPSATWELVFS